LTKTSTPLCRRPFLLGFLRRQRREPGRGLPLRVAREPVLAALQARDERLRPRDLRADARRHEAHHLAHVVRRLDAVDLGDDELRVLDRALDLRDARLARAGRAPTCLVPTTSSKPSRVSVFSAL